jgi:hypothetical protein
LACARIVLHRKLEGQISPAEVESCATKNIPSPASVEWLQSAIAVNGGAKIKSMLVHKKLGFFRALVRPAGLASHQFGPLLFNSDNVFDKIKLLGFNH